MTSAAPEPMSQSQPTTPAWLWLRTGMLGSVTISLSVGLISFNKCLMQPDRFPYAVPLALMHMGFCSVFAGILRALAPGLFPSLTDPARKIDVDFGLLLRGALPIGLTSAMSLVCANLAYKHLSVAFLQMLKETNIVLVYFFSLLAALEKFAWWHLQVILFAIFAASLTIRGELHFSFLGFAIQFMGQVAESIRIVMMSLLLSGKKLDALSCVLLISPVCFVLLGAFLAITAALPESMVAESLALPTAQTVYEWAPLLLASCTLAFTLNVSIALMIKHTSAVSYLFMGVMKDVVAVFVSVVALHEAVTGLQYMAFTLQIVAVLIWSLLKTYPDAVRDKDIFSGLASVARGERMDCPTEGETRPLMRKGDGV